MAELPLRRQDYLRDGLCETDLAPDPTKQFQAWLEQALAANLREPYAMTLATVSPSGQPTARIVLLRHFDDQGFTFFTNYLSEKGRHLADNPRACLHFFWPELERQVRIDGTVGFAHESISEAYFRQRPVGSQIAAAISEQSQIVPDRLFLEQRFADLSEKLKDQPVPRPPHWGGYILHPNQVEFWQGRANRLHDRLRYRRAGSAWVIERLSP